MITAKKKSAPRANVQIKTTLVKRLTPKPDVLRELYLLSGNNCAITDCDNVIIDHTGVVVGHVCHIEAAMPDGARFNPNQSNEDRRALRNLILLCSNHHLLIDSKKNEGYYTVPKLSRIKLDHEKKFKSLGRSLKQALVKSYIDSTDSLTPTLSSDFSELERLLPDTKLRSDLAKKRRIEISSFITKLSKVPDSERRFMVSIIVRAMKLDRDDGRICVHVDDVESAFEISQSKIKKLGSALKRYDVGGVYLASTDGDEDEDYHVILDEPSSFLTWADIARFCGKSGHNLDKFLIDLNFNLLD